MINDKDSLIGELKYNIKEKQRYIEVLQEELFKIKRIFETPKSPVIKKDILENLGTEG